MVVIDKRIAFDCCVEINSIDCSISRDVLMEWVSPFFIVQEEVVDRNKIITHINIVKDVQKNFRYLNNIFYVNADLSANELLYTLMSILRIVYKYTASIIGYQNLHAACLKCNDKGVLVTANRNQGKTTLILNAIQDTDFKLLANDQVMYNSEKNQLLGYPATVGIRINSCDLEKQKQINKKALWFVDDPFQNQPKPIIHIKDLSSIYQCEIAESAKLELLIEYQKAEKIDELVITDMEEVQFPISNMILPFRKTYHAELLDACEHSVGFYMKRFHINKGCNENRPAMVKRIKIICGILRISDMLYKLKTIL